MPDCFEEGSGTIRVVSTGGVEPIQYSIDGMTYQSSGVFEGLSGGAYTIHAADANACTAEEIIVLNAPLSVQIELGEDQDIESGDTVIIHAVVNVPYDSLALIDWTGLEEPACPTCLSQTVIPVITSTYSLTVMSVDGCVDADSLTLYVETNGGLYVPNVFSPNGDGINDVLLISAGTDINEIESFSIFDRWGNMVYLKEHFQPNDPGVAWDGTLRGENMNPGVYVYRLVARRVDGSKVARNGDVTLIR